MNSQKTDIYVYADWPELPQATLMGVLSAHQAKGRKSFSFSYDPAWLKSKYRFMLDPDIQWYSGNQFVINKENFGIFMDSMPDTWGRMLLKRKALLEYKEGRRANATLYDIDYLLGVHDESRMGALRFKLEPNGDFLNNDYQNPTPPWSKLAELQRVATHIENDDFSDSAEEWLAILLAPGSSLGGARPKANVLDSNQSLWIAKFPAKNDQVDKARWEFLAYILAQKAGINMAPSQLLRIGNHAYHTFLTQRFDRHGKQRIHFTSAMTLTGYTEERLRDQNASYLDLALFISNHCKQVNENLEQLWRRMVFNMAISNTDDHLRNHGFILDQGEWVLSPAYDINPSTDRSYLSLNINQDDNALDFELAKNVGSYFRLSNTRMNEILSEIQLAVSSWKSVATELGISTQECDRMSSAFRLPIAK